MDEDVPMDQDEQPGAEGSKPKGSSGDDLGQYNLDEYDNEDAMPGAYLFYRICLASIYYDVGL